MCCAFEEQDFWLFEADSGVEYGGSDEEFRGLGEKVEDVDIVALWGGRRDAGKMGVSWGRRASGDMMRQ
jgi:hypothetical protein